MIKLFVFLYSFFTAFSLSCSEQKGRHHPYEPSSKKMVTPLIKTLCRHDDRSEKASLFIAINRNQTVKILKTLVATRAHTALHEPLNNDTLLIKAADEGKTETIQFLLDQQVDINACNNYGQNIAWAIVQSDNLCVPVKLNVMEKLIAKGVNLRQVNKWGKSLLHVIDEPQLLEYLIQQIPELINAQDQDGNTPLHDAQTFNKRSTLELLLGNGAKPFIKNNKGLTYYEQPVLFNKNR